MVLQIGTMWKTNTYVHFYNSLKKCVSHTSFKLYIFFNSEVDKVMENEVESAQQLLISSVIIKAYKITLKEQRRKSNCHAVCVED